MLDKYNATTLAIKFDHQKIFMEEYIVKQKVQTDACYQVVSTRFPQKHYELIHHGGILLLQKFQHSPQYWLSNEVKKYQFCREC